MSGKEKERGKVIDKRRELSCQEKGTRLIDKRGKEEKR